MTLDDPKAAFEEGAPVGDMTIPVEAVGKKAIDEHKKVFSR